MDVLWETLAFVVKAFVVFLTVAACAAVVFAHARRARDSGSHGNLEVDRLDSRLRALGERLRFALLDPAARKRHDKEQARQAKARTEPDRSVFVLDFKGDMMATGVESLREEVTAVLAVASKDDEVVLRLESGGGAAHTYGLAAAQLSRLRSRGIPLTACVDKVAASGGYMMACVADRILVAPFAILGSIGVIAPVPNLHRLLDRVGVDYENVTAGEYKRTVSLLGEITEKGRAKFQEQLEETHTLFKRFVQENRPSLDIDAVATGEHWSGMRAAELGLADEVMTSDDYLLSKLDGAKIVELHFKRRRPVRERLSLATADIVHRVVLGVWAKLSSLRPPGAW